MNLESKIYELSFELSEAIDKNTLQKLLGVLASDGVYAMWVYAMDKLDLKFFENTEEMKKLKLFELLKIIGELDKYSTKKMDFDDLLNNVANLTKEINELNNKINTLKREIKNSNKGKIHEKKELDKIVKNKIKKRNQKLNQYFQELAQDLEKLLFMKDLLERVFIYALYHAKAKGD